MDVLAEFVRRIDRRHSEVGTLTGLEGLEVRMARVLFSRLGMSSDVGDANGDVRESSELSKS